MQDPRYDQLAEVLTGYSTRLQSGEKVLIDTFDVPVELVVALIRRAREKGAIPLVNREMLRGAEENQYQLIAEYEMVRMKGVAAYIAVRSSNNITEQSDVPPDR